ncbi:molecular chaperone Hsp33 [Alteribacillus persepolensis]|uniref:33 kDa chaperonin n=1 Tax=Alteribacillus persepolensis TaxID=568899 RepID=A0A1G8I185_9BACI|nr:Hsp33 family molecular chaperone HslO [Alteribacillus persepolensis]SDI12658.1 molecular chaperone Hsp33 [Alteribacillus persepolensis]
MEDYLIKTTAFDGRVRAYAVRTTNMVDEAVRRHQALPTAAAALGRAMTAGSMMGAMLKGDDKLTIKIEGRGPMGPIIIDSQSNGNTRGYAHHLQVHFDLNQQGKLDVARAVGTDGTLSVVKDLGMKEHFTGSVPIVSGELGEDFTYYFVSSEQVPSSVGLGVLVNPDNSILAAGGFIIQLLPGADDEIATRLEQQINNMPPVSKLIEKGKTPEEMLHVLFGEDFQLLDKHPVAFSCHCSKERVENALISLGTDELQDMIEKDKGAETQCHFCNEKYHFSEEDLKELQQRAWNIENDVE